jgi:hypothetical protein
MSEYFSHDYNSREDEKIINLIADMGYEGYGIYWAIIEMLYKNKGIMQTQYERIAFALHTDYDKVKKVIEAYQLFKNNQNNFWSESVKARLKIRKEKSETARQSAYSRWNKQDANAMRTQCDSNAKKKEINKKKESGSIERIFKENYNDPKYVTKPK